METKFISYLEYIKLIKMILVKATNNISRRFIAISPPFVIQEIDEDNGNII